MRSSGLVSCLAALVLASAASPSPAQQVPGTATGAAAASPVQAPAKAAACTNCHGERGNTEIPTNPIIAGLNSRYMYLQLRDFQEGRRGDPKTPHLDTTLTRDEMRELADYYSKQIPKPLNFKADPEKAKLGKVRADDTLCTMCHMGGFAGQNEIPRVAKQNFDYIVKQLHDFKARRRTNDAGNMTSVTHTLNELDIENIAHYVTGL